MPNYIVIHLELQIKSYIKSKWINQINDIMLTCFKVLIRQVLLKRLNFSAPSITTSITWFPCVARGGGMWAFLINKNTHKEDKCIQLARLFLASVLEA